MGRFKTIEIKKDLIMNNIFLFLALLTSLSVWAGNEKGNGGDAIVCRNQAGEITSAELLDYFEGRSFRRIPHVFDGYISHEQYLKNLAKKLNYFDEYKFKDFETESLSFLKAVNEYLESSQQSQVGYVFTDSPLVDVPDSKHLSIPANCQVEQLAVRVNQVYAEDPKFMIQGEILKSLSDDGVRGLILHEMIYKVFADMLGNNDSTKARFFHQMLTSKSLDDLDFLSYVNAIKPQNHVNIFHLGQTLPIWSLKELTEGDVKFDSYTSLIFRADGSFNVERTNSEGKSRGMVLQLSQADVTECYARLEYYITDSNGKRQYLSWTHKEMSTSEAMSFGQFTLEVEIKAKEKNCPVRNVAITFGRKTLLQLNNSKDAAVSKKLHFSIGDDFKFNVD